MDAGEILRDLCLSLAVPLLAGGVVVGLRGWRRARMEAAEARAAADRSCASCGGSALVWDADVYVCTDCRYEGGPGLAARDRRRRAEALRALPAEERVRQTTDALAEAERLFDEASAELASFRPRVQVAASYFTVRAEVLEDGQLQRALGQVAEAHAWLDRAAACVDRPVGASPLEIEPGMWVTELGEVDPVCVTADLDRAVASVEAGRRALVRLRDATLG